MLARFRVPVRCALRAAGSCGGAAPPCAAPQVPPAPSARRMLVHCRAASARAAPPADLFGDDADDFDLADRRPMSRTATKRQSDDFRKLCQELTTLPPRTLDRLALPADLRESIDEHIRIGGKRGTGSTKKGRARVEALMAQTMRNYEPEKAAKIVAAGNAAIKGEHFEPVDPTGEYFGRPTRARLAAAASSSDSGAAEQAEAWLRGLLDGDGDASTAVFEALTAAEAESRLDRVQLRQLISKALSEERAATGAAAAAAAAAAAVAAANAAAAAAAAEAGEVQQLRPPPFTPAKRKTPPATQRLRDALVGLARLSVADEEGSGSDEED